MRDPREFGERAERGATEEPLTPMTEAGIAMREMYLGMLAGGFTPAEAQSIIGAMLAASNTGTSENGN